MTQQPQSIEDLPARIQRQIERSAAYIPFAISTHDDAQQAANFLREVHDRYKQLEAERVAITKPLDETKKRVMALFAPALDRLASVETETKRSLTAWSREQERAAREQHQAAERAAAAEAERLRLEAQRASVMLDDEGAQDALQQAAAAETSVLNMPTPPKLHGFGTRTTYSASVTDLRALCAAVAQGIVSAEYVTPNLAVLNAVARSRKADGEWIAPGVVIVAEHGGSVR